MSKPTEVPLCDCHGEPMLWNKNATLRAGGTWICRIRRYETNSHNRTKERYRELGRAAARRYYATEKGCEMQRRWRSDPTPVRTTGQPASYGPVHRRHSKVLPRECALADETCKGRLDVALKHGVPEQRLLGAVGRHHGKIYSLDVADYMRLCHSHHCRYDKGTLVES